MSQDTPDETRPALARGGEADAWPNRGLQAGMVPQEMVDRIADKVYAMLLSEMKTGAERGRISLRKPFAERGGW
jgi:hypothetical protein